MMRFGVCLGIVLLAGASSEATRDNVGSNHLKDLSSHGAYRDVERSCAMDVELLCSPNMEFPLMTMLSSEPVLFFSASDLFTPALVMTEIMDSALGPHSSTSVFFQSDGSSSSTQAHAETRVFDSANELDEVFEIPQLAHDLRKHAESFVSDMGLRSDQSQAVARRLTESDTKPVQLPFRCRNQCLRTAFEKQMVSDKCARSIWMLQNTYALEAEFGRRQEEFVSRVLVYFTAVALLALVFSRRRGRSDKLNAKAIDAVRNNPAIRKQVELEIGESVECHGPRGKSWRGNETTTAVDQNKDLLPKTTIVCEGVPVQIV